VKSKTLEGKLEKQYIFLRYF